MFSLWIGDDNTIKTIEIKVMTFLLAFLWVGQRNLLIFLLITSHSLFPNLRGPRPPLTCRPSQGTCSQTYCIGIVY